MVSLWTVLGLAIVACFASGIQPDSTDTEARRVFDDLVQVCAPVISHKENLGSLLSLQPSLPNKHSFLQNVQGIFLGVGQCKKLKSIVFHNKCYELFETLHTHGFKIFVPNKIIF